MAALGVGAGAACGFALQRLAGSYFEEMRMPGVGSGRLGGRIAGRGGGRVRVAGGAGGARRCDAGAAGGLVWSRNQSPTGSRT